MRRFAPWAKLGVWGQTQWTKVILQWMSTLEFE
jgi:hypothetical protein